MLREQAEASVQEMELSPHTLARQGTVFSPYCAWKSPGRGECVGPRAPAPETLPSCGMEDEAKPTF